MVTVLNSSTPDFEIGPIGNSGFRLMTCLFVCVCFVVFVVVVSFCGVVFFLSIFLLLLITQLTVQFCVCVYVLFYVCV